MSDNKEITKVGTMTVVLEIGSLETGHPDAPNYFDVTGAHVVSTTLDEDQVNQLLADNSEEGIIGFENGEIDTAVENFRDGYQPTDPRIAILERQIRINFAPNYPEGALTGAATNWLKALDAAEWPAP